MLIDLTNGSISFKTSATEKPEAVPTIFQHVPQPKASTQKTVERKHLTKRTIKSECEAVSKQ